MPSLSTKSSLATLVSLALCSGAQAATALQHSSGLCLRTADNSSSPSNGTAVVLSGDCSGDAAAFSWNPGNSIQHQPSGLCIHPGGAAIPDNGQALVLWQGCDFADRVRFDATSANSLQQASSAKCVHPEGGSASPADGTALVMWEGCNEQRLAFSVVDQDGGSSASTAVDINLDTKHQVGTIDSFERKKYINVHASHVENDWFGGNAQSLFAENARPNLMDSFLEDFNVFMGRDTGGMKYELEQLPEDPQKPGYASAAAASTNGGGAKWIYSNTDNAQWQAIRRHAGRDDELIVGAQQRPYWPNGTQVGNQGWSFSQTDNAAEPLGTATADYLSQFVEKYFQAGLSDIGQPKPKYLEIMNEPLFELVEYPHAGENVPTIQQIFEFHRDAAREIRKNSANDDVLIGGYTVAFPDYEKGDTPFDQWKERDQLFLDIAGDDMDFVSIHLYDFPHIPYPDGTRRMQNRKGSNMEATLDMLEQYMAYKWGYIKPIVVSEYGSQLQGAFNEPWSPQRDWLVLNSMNAMTMSLMERPDRIAKAIPFVPIKAEWGRNTDGGLHAYEWRLMRQKSEEQDHHYDSNADYFDSIQANAAPSEWVYTELVRFYQLWSEVAGTRVDSYSTNPDVQVDAYVDGNDAYLILTSLVLGSQEVDLSVFGNNGASVSEVNIRHLYPDGQGRPKYDAYQLSSLPNSVTLGAEASMIVKISYDNVISIDHISQETKHYAAALVTNISANVTQSYSINNVDKGSYGEAVLRVGVGRDHYVPNSSPAVRSSLQPEVLINGVRLNVPDNYRGYDQYHGGLGRDRFFGVLEIPVPYSALNTNNTIQITFPDNGGAVSSVTLQHFKHSKQLSR